MNHSSKWHYYCFDEKYPSTGISKPMLYSQFDIALTYFDVYIFYLIYHTTSHRFKRELFQVNFLLL